MTFEDRNLVLEKLNALEQQYPVDTWRINGIDIWPVLKRELFFFEYKKAQHKKSKKPRPSFARKVMSAFKRRLSAYIQLMTLKLSASPFVFAGTPSHRVRWDGKAYNRYFDPIISYLSSRKVTSYFTEYRGIDKDAVFHQGNFIDCSILIHAFRGDYRFLQGKEAFKAEWLRLSKEPAFQAFLAALRLKFPAYEKDMEKLLLPVLKEIESWRQLYTYLFRKIKPTYAVGLCYYSYAIYGMNLAAHDLGVTSVDMQHGGQGALHPAYSFTKIPDQGFNTLPKEFWCWDEVSCAHIEGWSAGKAHQARLLGNPWFAFLKENALTFEENFPKDKQLILFSHQPMVPVLDQYLLESIKQTKEIYHWWIRLHPRISKTEEEALKILLKEHGIFDDVELQKATHLPLPVVLNQAAVHISKFSGTIIEGVMLGVPTIILEEVGYHTFTQLIKEGKAIALPHPNAEKLQSTLMNVLQLPRNAAQSHDYKQFINECLAKVQL